MLGVVVVAVVIAIVLRAFVVATYSIPSGSMEPTLQIGDRIVVDKLSYHLHGVDRADIVVFSTPPKEDCAGPPVSDLVKRVIGLPGETIALSAGRVVINGRVLARALAAAGHEDRDHRRAVRGAVRAAPSLPGSVGGRLRDG